jgi:hypothetical protein
MSTHIVMDTSGDTRHEFDPTDPSAVTEAERRFLDLKKAGYIAARRTLSGRSELLEHFDPTVQETLFIPRLIGG